MTFRLCGSRRRGKPTHAHETKSGFNGGALQAVRPFRKFFGRCAGPDGMSRCRFGQWHVSSGFPVRGFGVR